MSAVIINLADHRASRMSGCAVAKQREPSKSDMEALAAARFCLGFRDLLTENQRDFIDSICRTLPEKSLTERQDDWLAGIVQKIMRYLDRLKEA